MLYTRKGDSGTTKALNSKERISKSSSLFEALGTIDELNSFLGLCKVKTSDKPAYAGREAVESIQQDLFIIQAELAGADMAISGAKVERLEELTDKIEKLLPPIKSFFVSGGTELAALFDTARTIARRAERRVILAKEAGEANPSAETLGYLNRLSSALYALARYANYAAQTPEHGPRYEI